ncbi:uncharacterized protein V6R79_025239 [Siganus canaliculatus]
MASVWSLEGKLLLRSGRDGSKRKSQIQNISPKTTRPSNCFRSQRRGTKNKKIQVTLSELKEKVLVDDDPASRKVGTLRTLEADLFLWWLDFRTRLLDSVPEFSVGEEPLLLTGS